MVQNRDYTLIIDKSGSMIKIDRPGGKSRWLQMQESTLALAGKCDTIDPNGITVNLYFKNKSCPGETILVITDGEPDARKAVMKVIIDASRRIEKDEQLAISFI